MTWDGREIFSMGLTSVRRTAVALAVPFVVLGLLAGSIDTASAAVSKPKPKPARRIAWVIGIDGQSGTAGKPSPAGDARAIAKMLKEDGFESVVETVNADRAAMLEALDAFSKSVRPDDVVLVSFSGASFEIDGKLFIAPVGMVDFKDLTKLKLEPIPVADILEAMDASKNLRMLVFDGSRTSQVYDPAPAKGAPAAAQCPTAVPGRIEFYSTRHGQPALDHVPDKPKIKHSPFVQALIVDFDMADPHGLYSRVFKAVVRASKRTQAPVMCGLSEVTLEHLDMRMAPKRK